jgi:hypothetical protein
MHLTQTQNIQNRRPLKVKSSRNEINSRVHKIPEIRFEDQKLTSFAGLVVIQSLFARLRLKERLRGCFDHFTTSPIFGYHVIVMVLMVHLILGYRRLRDMDYYRDDPMVQRLLGLNRLPDVATVSRAMAAMDGESISKIRRFCRTMVIERVRAFHLWRLTLDVDGSVSWTASQHTEGTAVGYNRKKKGARSYYPLFCTIAQTGQVFDVWHRPGNVHDSNGAEVFIRACIEVLREALPWVRIEVRTDGAFFSDAMVSMLDGLKVEFSVSVPFERFAELKGKVESRKQWKEIDTIWSYFETDWKPKCWSDRYRFIFFRQRCPEIYKGPIQLDLFIPREYGYTFKVMVTNKPVGARKALVFHHGRGSQEGFFGELKSQCQMDYIPVRRLHGNQLYLMAGVLAHNVIRELQMMARPPERKTTEKRSSLLIFEQLATLRNRLFQRAGRFTVPQKKLTLTMSANEAVQKDLLHFLEILKEAA